MIFIALVFYGCAILFEEPLLAVIATLWLILYYLDLMYLELRKLNKK